MPLFDFICRSCGKKFEALVMGSSKPKCPECQSGDLLRIGAVVILPHQAVRAAVRVVPVVRAQAAVHVIKEV